MIGLSQSNTYQQSARQQQQQQPYKNESATKNQHLSPQSKQQLQHQQNVTVEDLQIELGLLNSKYQNALERLAEKTGLLSAEDYHTKIYQLEQAIGREKEKALRVILKLERDLEAQEKRNNFETLKLTSQIESLHAINAQLQKELTQQTEFNQKDKVLQLALQEKEDAESVVKELRKHNEALLSQQVTNRSSKESEREAIILNITQENQLLKNKLSQMEAAVSSQSQQDNTMQRQCENLKRENQSLIHQLESLKISSAQAQSIQHQVNMQSQGKQELERIKEQLVVQLEAMKLQCLNAETKVNERQNEVAAVRQQLLNAVEERQSILQKYERAVCDKETHSQTILLNQQENSKLKEKLKQLESERDQMYFDLQQVHKYREEQARNIDQDNQTNKQQILRDLQLSRNESDELRSKLAAQSNQLSVLGQIQAQLTQLQTRYVQLEQQNDQLKQSNNQLNSQNVYLVSQQSDSGKYSDRIAQITRDLELAERAKLAIQSELKNHIQQTEREKEEIRLNQLSSSDQLKHDNSRLASEITSVRNEINLRNNEATRLLNVIKELEIKNQELQASNDRLVVQEILYQQSQKDLQTKDKMFQAMDTENKLEIEKLKGQIMQLQNSKDLVLSDFIRVEAELKKVSQQQTFNGQLAQAEKDKIQANLASCQNQITQLLQNNQYIEDKLKVKDLECSRLQEQLEKAKSSLNAVTVDLEETRRILEEITRKYDQSKKECMEVSLSYERLKQQHDYVVVQHETVKQKHAVVAQQCDQLSLQSKDQMNELKMQNEQLSLRVAEGMSEKNKISGEIMQIQQENKRIQEQLKIYLAEKLELEMRLAQAEADKHKLLDDKNKLETDKSIVSMQINKLEREKEQLQQQFRDYEKIVAEKKIVENARDQAIKDLQNARNDINSAQMLFSNSAARVKELEESIRKEGVKYSSLLVENGKLEDHFKLKGSQQQLQIDQNNQQYEQLCKQVQLQLDQAERELRECISSKDAKINEVQRQLADLETQKGFQLAEKEKIQREYSQREQQTQREIASLKEQSQRDQAAFKYLQEQSRQQLADYKDKATQELKAFEELSQQRGVLLDQKEATIHSLTQQLHSTQRSLIQKNQVQDNVRILPDNNIELKELQLKNINLENEIALITTKSQQEISSLSKQLHQLQLSQKRTDKQLNDDSSLSIELQATKQELEKAYEFIESKKQECLLLSNNYAVIKEELLRVTQEHELLQQQEYDGDGDDQSQDNNGLLEESLRTQNEILKQTNRALLLNIVDLEKRSVSTHSRNNNNDENNNYHNNKFYN